MLREIPDINLLIEVGPHPALAGPLRQTMEALKKQRVEYLPTLKRGELSGNQMLRLAGNLWLRDGPIDVSTVTEVQDLTADGTIDTKEGTVIVDLPPYHWTYSKAYWAESRLSKEQRSVNGGRHDILGRRLNGSSSLEPIWRNILRQDDLPWLTQHRIGGEVILPAAGYIALAVEALTQINSQSDTPLPIHSYTLREVVIPVATVIPDDDTGTETLFRLCPMKEKTRPSSDNESSQWYEFNASCYSYGTWKQTARGKVALNVRRLGSPAQSTLPSTTQRSRHIDWLDKMRTVGFDFGTAFHLIDDLYTDRETHTSRGQMNICNECGLMKGESRYVYHPTVLDSCLQPFLATLHRGRLEELRCGMVPTNFDEVTLYPPSPEQLREKCDLQAWIPKLGNRAFLYNSQLVAQDGSLLVDITGCRTLVYNSALPQEMTSAPQQDLYIKTEWEVDTDYLSWAQEA